MLYVYMISLKICFVLVNDASVHLKPTMKIPGSNYINASFVDVSLRS